MLEMLAPFFMTGGWAAGVNVAGTDVMRDVNGIAILVGSTVAWIGTVTALDPHGTHFDDVTVDGEHPEQDLVIPARSLKFHPLELVVSPASF